MTPDPAFRDPQTGEWWFWDETWCYEQGPFDTEEECRASLAEYVKNL